jgi:hypothetical protein
VVETVLSRQLDELEPLLTRHGYNVKSLATQFHTKPAEIRQFLRGALNEQGTKTPCPDGREGTPAPERSTAACSGLGTSD